MTPAIIGLIGLIILLVLIFMRVWTGVAMAIVGFVGYAYLGGLDKALLMIGMDPYSQTAYQPLTAIPLFILMGSIVSAMGIGEELFNAVRRWVGHVRGGLAMATVGACGLFAAICGDSVATAVTMGKVAHPEMRRHNYDEKLAVSTIVAGGTIGILIPPSMGFILYGLLTEQSIGQLFIAGFIPGILQVLFYMVTIYITCTIFPKWGPPGPRYSFKERIIGTTEIWPMLFLFLTIIIGIYLGVFTPTEAGAIGAFGAILLSIARRKFTWQTFRSAAIETASSTSMILLLLIGAFILTRFIALTQLPVMLGDLIVGLDMPRIVILLVIVAFYIFIGCFLNVIVAIILTVPIIYPTIVALGYDPIWWGVVMVRMMEMSMITPPVGLNIFVIARTTNTPVGTIYRGIAPFIVSDLAHTALLLAVPEISLYLVHMMK